MKNFADVDVDLTGTHKYTGVAMLLHWLIAFLMIANVVLGLGVALLMPKGILSGMAIGALIGVHKSIGISVLLLAVLRVLWRLTHRPPPLPRAFAAWERATAHLAHIVLYLLIFAMPLTGWLYDGAYDAFLAANHPGESHPLSLFGLVPWPHLSVLLPAAKPWLAAHLKPIGELHEVISYALYGVLALHICGALKHQWIDRNSVLRRMLPWR